MLVGSCPFHQPVPAANWKKLLVTGALALSATTGPGDFYDEVVGEPSLAVPVASARAALPAGASVVPDDGVADARTPPGRWRSFGHVPRNGVHFDRQGNWADTQTAVTADQFAAMPAAQQQHFLQRTRLDPGLIQAGTADRALVYPAVHGVLAGEPLDRRRSFGVEPDGSRTFGHRPVAGQLFALGRWKDTGTVVTADQAAAMPPAQRKELAHSAGLTPADLKLGLAERVVIEVDTSRDDPVLAELVRTHPGKIVTHRGHRLRADTALAYQRLERRLEEIYPERKIVITSTMAGRNPADAHGQGRAVDFLVQPLSLKESKTVERLVWEAGLRPYNEYLYDSPGKTGPHMHVQLP